MIDEFDRKIGTKDHTGLSAGSVIVNKITIKEKPTKKGGKVKIAYLHCKHPDKEELIELSSVKIKKTVGNNETIMKDALWYHLDDEQNLQKDSNISVMLRHYKKQSLREIIGSHVDTEQDAVGYLCIKAY